MVVAVVASLIRTRILVARGEMQPTAKVIHDIEDAEKPKKKSAK
jgi:hypothetical protein